MLRFKDILVKYLRKSRESESYVIRLFFSPYALTISNDNIISKSDHTEKVLHLILFGALEIVSLKYLKFKGKQNQTKKHTKTQHFKPF